MSNQDSFYESLFYKDKSGNWRLTEDCVQLIRLKGRCVFMDVIQRNGVFGRKEVYELGFAYQTISRTLFCPIKPVRITFEVFRGEFVVTDITKQENY